MMFCQIFCKKDIKLLQIRLMKLNKSNINHKKGVTFE